ncbi:alpha/beta fold hydrolase [Furfurilactobacillus sp. WILCCON 0119]
MFFVDQDTEAQVFYKRHGSGPKKVVVLHGYGMDHRSMTHVIDRGLADREDIEATFIDLPGMGQTKADTIVNADQVVDLLARMISSIYDGKAVNIIGFSYGGYLAQGLLYKHADLINRFLLLAPAFYAGSKQRKLPAQAKISQNVMEQMKELDHGDHYLQLTGKPEMAQYERFITDIQSGFNCRDVSFLERYSENGYQLSFEKAMHEAYLSNSGIIVLSTSDHIVGYEDIMGARDHFPNTDFFVLRGLGHIIQVDAENKIIGIIRYFFELQE